MQYHCFDRSLRMSSANILRDCLNAEYLFTKGKPLHEDINISRFGGTTDSTYCCSVTCPKVAGRPENRQPDSHPDNRNFNLVSIDAADVRWVGSVFTVLSQSPRLRTGCGESTAGCRCVPKASVDFMVVRLNHADEVHEGLAKMTDGKGKFGASPDVGNTTINARVHGCMACVDSVEQRERNTSY